MCNDVCVQAPKVFFAPSFDLGDKDGGIHPRNKQVGTPYLLCSDRNVWRHDEQADW